MLTVHLLLSLWIFYPSFALKLPSYMKACSLNDPKLNECVVKSGRAAIPQFIHGDTKYGVPELDPFIIPELKVNQGTKEVGLTLTLTKVKLTGLRNIEFVNARVDTKKKHIEWDFKIKTVQLISPYKATGKVLLLPVTGEGMSNITLTDSSFTYKFDYNLIKRKGKDYLSLGKTDYKYEVGRAYFHFKDLFNGDKLLGDNMNKFLNENWKELIKTFGPKMASALEDIFKKIFQRICELVPYDEIFLQQKA